MAEALVTPEILRWARERAGLPLEILAKKIGSKPENVAAWEGGLSRPTFRQAERLAEATHVPFGYLFLPEPPEESLPIPDLRRAVGGQSPHLDADFKDALRDVQFKFDWYRDYRTDQGYGPLPFVGRFRPPADPTEVADDIRRTLRVDVGDREQARTWEDYFRLLIAKAEHAGVWVMRNGVVGNNSHRPLSVDVFRGFAISDPMVPAVFVNGRDAKAAQIFTLAHELAHIWLGQSGISDPFRVGGGTEELCNMVAAEFLVPRTEFIAVWAVDEGIGANAQRLSARFRVSQIVIAIRARDLGLIANAEFDSFFEAEKQRWRRQRDESESGGNYYRTAKARNGEPFLRAVLVSAMSGHLLLRNAGALLNMTPKSLREAYRRQQAGEL